MHAFYMHLSECLNLVYWDRILCNYMHPQLLKMMHISKLLLHLKEPANIKKSMSTIPHKEQDKEKQ